MQFELYYEVLYLSSCLSAVDPMACDQMKDTPLHLCAENNNVEIAKLLLEAKSDVTLKNTNGRRPVDVAKLFQMRDVQGYLRRQEKTSPFFAV